MNGYNNLPAVSLVNVALRILLESLARRLPDEFQYRFFANLKKVKNFFIRHTFPDLLHSWDHIYNTKLYTNSEHNPNGTFTITHDIDYPEGYQYLSELINRDEKLKINATYTFLTNAGYTIENDLLFIILNKGNEIGLHGMHHDRALGFRSRKYIHNFLKSSKTTLEKRIGHINGFRAPALAITDKVIFFLEELGFTYDSSLTNSALYSSFTPYFRPYILEESNIIEIPLTFQDSMFINDIPLSLEQRDKLISNLIKMAEDYGLQIVLNFHPVLIKPNLDSYIRIIEKLKNSSLENCLMKEMKQPDNL